MLRRAARPALEWWWPRALEVYVKSPLLVLFSLALVTGCGDKDYDPGDDDDTGDVVDEFANIAVSESALDFGEVYYGDIQSLSFNISNTGGAQLDVLTFDVPSPFSASVGAGITVSPGTTLTVTVSYLPDDYAADSGDLLIVTNDPDTPEVTVSLAGSVITDADADGHASVDAGGEDCDDDDPDVNPDADDFWYDGEDSNCDGADDYDQDGDGFQASGYNDDPDDGGGDCQDANPDMYPGAVDVWYDGEDTNCDGADDFDQDGDDFGSAEYGAGSDCDDTNPDVNREGTEVFNNLDDDCNGDADDKVPGDSSEYFYSGTDAGEYAGYSVAVGDLDGDGYGEVVAGALNYSSGRGAVAVFDGYTLPATGGDFGDSDNLIVGDGGTDELGSSTVVFDGDFDGDGYAELIMGADGAGSGYGKVFVLDGDDALVGDTSDSYITISSSSYTNWGDGIYASMDMDADGYADLAGTATASSNNYVWLLYGGTSISGALSHSSLDAMWTLNAPTEYSRHHPPNPGDLDGDGYDDILACDRNSDYDNTNDGAVYVQWGSSTRADTSGSTQSWTTNGQVLAAGEKYDQYGWFCAIGPDWDGDGDGEFWSLDEREEAMYLVAGDSDLRDSTMDVTDHAWASYEWSSSDPTPLSLVELDDLDGDGYNDVAFSMEATSSKAGQVWVVGSSSADGSELDLSKDIIGSIIGSTDGFQGELGWGLDAGDINGDGLQELVVGDYDYGDSSTGDTSRGGIWFSMMGQP